MQSVLGEIYAAIDAGDMEKLKTKLDEQHGHLNYMGLDLGFIYHSSAISSENQQILSITPSEYIPTTLPGSRAPHMQLIKKDGKSISTLDLFEKEFVLLIGQNSSYWQNMADELSHILPFPLKVYRVANDGNLIDQDNTWYNIYNLTDTGAVLVRPDGHVAWRSQSIVDEYSNKLKEYFKNIGASESSPV